MTMTVTVAVSREKGAPLVVEELELDDPRSTEVRGQCAPDEQVHLHGRVPRGAVDLGPVRDVKHPQPFPGTGHRHRAHLPRTAAAR